MHLYKWEGVKMEILQTKYSKTKIVDNSLYENPQSTQEIFPIKSIDESGVFELAGGKYSKMFRLTDVNYAGVTEEEQQEIILNFSKVLNSIGCRFSYTVAKEHIDDTALSNHIYYKKKNDGLNELREDFNNIIHQKLSDTKKGLYQTIYLTLTLESKTLKDAKLRFSTLEGTLRTVLISIGANGMAGSRLIPVGINERIQTLYKFTHLNDDSHYKFDFYNEMILGRSFRDIVAPSSADFYNDYFVLNKDTYGAVFYISKYPGSLEHDLLSRLADINCTNYISINNELLDYTALINEVKRKNAKVNIKIESEKNKNRRNNDFLSDASDVMLRRQEKLSNFYDKIESEDDRYFNTTIMIMLLTHSKKELDAVCDEIKNISGEKSFEYEPCFSKQREGINSAFMFGVQEYKCVCNFSASCLAMFMPFKTQEINEENGIYLGVNQLSQNPIMANRKNLDNKAGVILGMTRSGKSVFAKCEIISTYLNNKSDQFLIIDPQNEYGPLTEALGGTKIAFDSTKDVFVNPMDVDFENIEYATLQNIISEKVDFILTLLSSSMGRNLNSEEMGVVDDAVTKVYTENYALRKKLNGEEDIDDDYDVPDYMKKSGDILPIKSDFTNEEQIKNYSPVLQDVYQELIDQDKPVSKNLAASMHVFVNGSLNLFNHRTNIDLNKRFLSFDISGIKENLRNTAMLVMLEIVRSKIKSNHMYNMYTHLYIDEFHELLGIDTVAEFVIKLWKEVGKMQGIVTGITQNMTDLLTKSSNATQLEAILGNTSYFVLLNQSTFDREKLSEFLPSISSAMFNYVEGADAGTGLLVFNGICIPFDMRISNKKSKIFQISNTSGENAHIGAI